ncbi:MAG TPA: L-dopachrome tautomerase-related protein [Thermoanaerobaculia bacterium]|nr:L-dopachrome tautomerase-related protein [Thermoanaerobaculia bacterium]
MKKWLARLALLAIALVAVVVVTLKIRYGGDTVPFPDTSTKALLPASAVELVATLDEPPGNIAVSRDGRVFFSLHPEARPDRKVVEWVNGKALPFPDGKFDLFHEVLSVRIDSQNRLWTIDHGLHGLRQPRLLAFDIATRRLVHRWDIPRDVAGFGSFVQDFQVAPDGATVYLADAGIVSKRPAILVYDVASKRARRVLECDASVTGKPYTLDIQGHEMSLLGGLYKMHVGIDPIALDAKGEWLYFGPMSHETMFRARTADLRAGTPRVEPFGPKPQCDGIAVDGNGNVYITDIEHGAIARLGADRKLVTLVRDDRFRWLDGFSFGPDGSLYATDSALTEVILQSKSHIRAKGPYSVWRVRVPARSPAPSLATPRR